MQKVASGISSLVRISSSYLLSRSYRGVSSFLPNCAPPTPRRQYRLWLPFEHRGGINGTHGPRIASQIRYPNTLLAMNISHSVPCNMTESGRMLMASDKLRCNNTFIVRRANSLDDLQWVMHRATEEGWRQCENDAECCFTAGLTSAFFIGELNGDRIGSVSLVRHGDSPYFVGYLMVLKSYRGQGYGKKI